MPLTFFVTRWSFGYASFPVPWDFVFFSATPWGSLWQLLWDFTYAALWGFDDVSPPLARHLGYPMVPRQGDGSSYHDVVVGISLFGYTFADFLGSTFGFCLWLHLRGLLRPLEHFNTYVYVYG